MTIQLPSLNGHIGIRYAPLIDAPGTRIAYSHKWEVNGVRMYVDGVKTLDGGLHPLLTVGYLTLNEEEARLFTHQACEVRAAMLGLRELSA
jgi:hypothetical protein